MAAQTGEDLDGAVQVVAHRHDAAPRVHGAGDSAQLPAHTLLTINRPARGEGPWWLSAKTRRPAGWQAVGWALFITFFSALHLSEGQGPWWQWATVLILTALVVAHAATWCHHRRTPTTGGVGGRG